MGAKFGVVVVMIGAHGGLFDGAVHALDLIARRQGSQALPTILDRPTHRRRRVGPSN